MHKIEVEAEEILQKVYQELGISPTPEQNLYCMNTLIKHLMFR